jgi:hypothetical protein
VAAGISDHVWSIKELVRLPEVEEEKVALAMARNQFGVSLFGLLELKFFLLPTLSLTLVLWKEILSPDKSPEEQENGKNTYDQERRIFLHLRLLSIQIPRTSKKNAKVTATTDHAMVISSRSTSLSRKAKTMTRAAVSRKNSPTISLTSLGRGL